MKMSFYWKFHENFLLNRIFMHFKHLNNHKVIFITQSSRTLHDNFSHVMMHFTLFLVHNALQKFHSQNDTIGDDAMSNQPVLH